MKEWNGWKGEKMFRFAALGKNCDVKRKKSL